MKNIHLIPTDQPSKLLFNPFNKSFSIQKEDDGMFINDGKVSGADFWSLEKASNNGFKPQHIYITSLEKIKEGEYYLGDDNHIYNLVTSVNNNGKKIILTTNTELIEEGIQSIDDEFLEWFVKNPSCEFVEVNKKLVEFPLTFKMMYKIIIPQDETGKYFADNADVIITMERPKEVRYSEDEVRELLIKGLTHNDDKLCGSLVTVQKEIRTANFNVWFEENKKK
jgi:hypothetical protein